MCYCFVLKNCTTKTTFKTVFFYLIPQSGQTDISGLDLHTEHNRSPSGHYNFIYFSLFKLIKGTVIVSFLFLCTPIFDIITLHLFTLKEW